MYGVRPARLTLDELFAESRELLAKTAHNAPQTEPLPIVWSCAEGRWINNPEYATFKHGKFQR